MRRMFKSIWLLVAAGIIPENALCQSFFLYFDIRQSPERNTYLEIDNLKLGGPEGELVVNILKKELSTREKGQDLIARQELTDHEFTWLSFEIKKIVTYAGSAMVHPKVDSSPRVFRLDKKISCKESHLLTLIWKAKNDVIRKNVYHPSLEIVSSATRPLNTLGVITLPESGNIILFDRLKKQVVSVTKAGDQPTGLAYSPEGQRLFVANKGSNSISIFQLPGVNLIKECPLHFGDSPKRLVMSPDFQRIYILNEDSKTITVFETNSYQEINRIFLSFEPNDLVVSDVSRTLYIGGESEFLWIFDEFDFHHKQSIPVNSSIGRILLENTSQTLAISLTNNREVTTLDLVSSKFKNKISLCEQGSDISFHPLSGNLVVAIPLCNTISFYKFNNVQEFGSIRMDNEPLRIYTDPDGINLYVIQSRDPFLIAYNFNSLDFIARLELGEKPFEVLFTY